MKPGNLEPTESCISDLPLDDEHAHILLEYDQGVIPLHCLTETIETAGGRILQIIVLREGPEGRRSVLVRLGTQDARNAILSLSKYPLRMVEGFNSGKGLRGKLSRKR
jgi:hypothetical protein